MKDSKANKLPEIPASGLSYGRTDNGITIARNHLGEVIWHALSIDGYIRGVGLPMLGEYELQPFPDNSSGR